MRKEGIRDSRGDRIFLLVNGLLVALFVIVTIYPLYFTVIASVSDPYMVAKGDVYLIPRKMTLAAYRNIIQETQIWVGYLNTIFYTVFGTLFNLLLTIPCAYVMSKPYLPGKKILNWFFLIIMYFSGGLVPTYLMVRDLGLVDTRWVLILLGGLSVYNMIVARTFYATSIPAELYEAATIDGCGEWQAFLRIALPLSAPIIAVIGLYYGVKHWNSYFNALIYTSSKELQPLQLVLRNILILNQEAFAVDGTETAEDIAYMVNKAYLAQSMKYALVFIASAPILCVYPFLQKYFVKGVMIGSIKG